MAPRPTFRIAPRPKRTRLSPTTVKRHPDSFTSGASTSICISRASAMYLMTSSVFPMFDDSNAAMNSAGWCAFRKAVWYATTE